LRKASVGLLQHHFQGLFLPSGLWVECDLNARLKLYAFSGLDLSFFASDGIADGFEAQVRGAKLGQAPEFIGSGARPVDGGVAPGAALPFELEHLPDVIAAALFERDFQLPVYPKFFFRPFAQQLEFVPAEPG